MSAHDIPQERKDSDDAKLMKANHIAILLIEELRTLVHSENPLLTEMILEILEQVVKIEKRLSRIYALTR